MTTTVPERLVDELRRGTRFLITSHIHPDGDAIGSALGMARILEAAGKTATIWMRDPAPSVYQVLPGVASIHLGTAPPAGFPDAFDHLIVLECPTPARTGIETAVEALPVLNIDHHLGNESYGKIDWIDTDSAAVGVMVHRIARRLGVEIDAETATLLYLALFTDTGGFRFSNTTPDAFDSAAALVRAGASPETVSQWLYESQPASVLTLVGETLRTLETHADGRIATVWLTQEMLRRAGAKDGDSEGLIDYPRSIAGVDAVALIRQIDDTTYKFSLRSRGAIDVEKVARSFGGGGHPNAAGFTATGDRERLFERALAALTEALESARTPVPATAH